MKKLFLLVVLVLMFCCTTSNNSNFRVVMRDGKLRTTPKSLKIDHPVHIKVDTIKLKHK